MFDFNSLPLTPELSRAARNYFGFTQAKAAEESGLPAHKIKRFEAGNYIPDIEFLGDLRAFYERRGYKFDDTPVPGAKAKESGLVFPAGVVGETEKNPGSPSGSRPTKASFHHMRIAITDEAEMGRVLDMIQDNEEKAERLLREPMEGRFGLFGGFSEDAEASHGEALKLLAENGLLFAKLFGRHVGGKPKPESLDAASKKKPETHADLLHRLHADTLLAVAGDGDAADRRKARKPASTLKTAIFG